MKLIRNIFVFSVISTIASSCVITHSIHNLGNNTYAAETSYKGKLHISLCTADASGNLTCSKGTEGPSALSPAGTGFGNAD